MALYYTTTEDEATKIKSLKVLLTSQINKKKTFYLLTKDGNHFGEICFFTGGERKLYAKSTDFTTLFTIKREDFLHVLSKYPEDFVFFSKKSFIYKKHKGKILYDKR